MVRSRVWRSFPPDFLDLCPLAHSVMNCQNLNVQMEEFASFLPFVINKCQLPPLLTAWMPGSKGHWMDSPDHSLWALMLKSLPKSKRVIVHYYQHLRYNSYQLVPYKIRVQVNSREHIAQVLISCYRRRVGNTGTKIQLGKFGGTRRKKRAPHNKCAYQRAIIFTVYLQSYNCGLIAPSEIAQITAVEYWACCYQNPSWPHYQDSYCLKA